MTGGTGFLGKHLSYPSTISDLLNSQTEGEFLDARPDTVLHLAALCGGIQYNLDHPADLYHVNVQMALNVFKAAKMAGVRRVVTIGSTCAYPSGAKAPFETQDYHKGQPEYSNASYGLAKRAICTLGDAYQMQHGIEHLHIVLANLYGPGDKSDHVIPMLFKKFRGPGPVEVWGDGTSTREFLYVEDAARIVKNLTESSDTGIVNVGSGEVVTIAELSKKIQSVTGFLGRVEFNPMKPGGQKDRLLDSSHKGTTPLEVGLKNIT